MEEGIYPVILLVLEIEDLSFTVYDQTKSEEKPAQRFPAPPFTTSTLQQEAGRKLGMSVSQTENDAPIHLSRNTRADSRSGNLRSRVALTKVFSGVPSGWKSASTL